MFSFMILTSDINVENLKKAESHFSFKFNSGGKRFISGFSTSNNMSVICGKDSLEFAFYDQNISKDKENLIKNYFLHQFNGEIDGVSVDGIDNYYFLNEIVDKEKVIH